MLQIWAYNPPHILPFRHLLSILSLLNQKLKPPKPIALQPKATTHCWAFRITEEPELVREKRIIYLLWGVAKFFKEGEVWMRFWCWERKPKVERYPSFFVQHPDPNC
jgi:hypothetical protein